MAMRRPIHNRLVGKLEVETEFGAFLGDKRIRLLEAIDRYGSISQAAKAVPMSYKAAWDAVDAMNNIAEESVVDRSVGGRHGGGTQLTGYGRRLVAMYRAVEQENQATLERLTARLGDANAADIGHFQSMLKRVSMRTSARNQFAGPVTGLREGDVSFEVRLRVDTKQEVSAVITRESAESMSLSIGREVHALVKASAVILCTDRSIRTTARNQLWGVVSRIHAGTVNSEVAITLPSGRVIAAVVTRDSVATLGLAIGSAACALFKASSVILATFD
jgi:molybdate transport system regulatory protein